MVVQEERAAIKFSGSRENRQLAEQVLELLRARGRFMSADAPIRASLSSVADYLAGEGGLSAEEAVGRLEAMSAANPNVFTIEQIGDERVIVTTREGRKAGEPQAASRHTFAQRFLTPLPKPELPPQPIRERARVDPSWATLPAVLDDLDFEDEEGIEAGAEDAEAMEAIREALIAEVTVGSDEGEPTVIDVEPEREVEPEAVPVAARTITVPVATPTDVTEVDDSDLAAALRERLQADPRVANFGEQWLMEDRVQRFSRGDLRRMKDYLQEQEQPLPDDVLVQDVLGVRQGSADFEALRFAVNFRLSREHREFEFVGTSNQRFWSTSGLPQIGTSRRKPNEIGSDYRYLLEEMGEAPAVRTRTPVDHVLTFYEYQHGLLPYDADMQSLLLAPLLPAQKSAVLTFESPQSYTTYLVELRYPTPNRGGFILGLDDLYAENLVAGAILSIAPTDNDGHYLVEYIAEAGQSARLVELDERRAQRYVFRPTTYACGVEEGMLLTEERYGRLNGEKPVDEKVRRRPESVVAVTFERFGEHREANFSADFATLLAGANVERPISAHLLRTILEHDDTGAFSRDPDQPDAYTYVPGTPS
jgi:hypothetical protein